VDGLAGDFRRATETRREAVSPRIAAPAERGPVFEQQYWKSYQQVNHLFCEEVLKVARPGDSVWVHDFQLMLLPQLLRERMPDLEIGYFHHIPWPSSELFCLLPWREEILEGLLGADLVGFHTYDYVRHFLSGVSRIAGLEHTLGEVNARNRIIKVDAFPMGIDYDRYARAIDNPEIKSEADRIRGMVGRRKIIVSIDRLDYTKGIVERLEAFDWFLTTCPEYKGHVTLIIVAEHGGWLRRIGQAWTSFQPVNEQWKHTIRPIMDLYSDRTPGALVEEKDFSLVWHYRRADPTLAYVRTHELRDALVNLTENMDVGVFEGSKILEVRKHGINKGRAAEFLIGQEPWTFVLAAGDDYTDEEMFAVLPEQACSIKVGTDISKARFNVGTVVDLRNLLKQLAGD